MIFKIRTFTIAATTQMEMTTGSYDCSNEEYITILYTYNPGSLMHLSDTSPSLH
jgi:hypothetical protein